MKSTCPEDLLEKYNNYEWIPYTKDIAEYLTTGIYIVTYRYSVDTYSYDDKGNLSARREIKYLTDVDKFSMFYGFINYPTEVVAFRKMPAPYKISDKDAEEQLKWLQVMNEKIHSVGATDSTQ